MGFDPSRFRDLPLVLEDELTCTICHCILYKAVITTCGHAFCKECIITWFLQEKTCPVCRKIVHKICKPPVIVSNLLSKLRVDCSFKERGCTQVLPLDAVDSHEKNCRHRIREGFFRSLLQKEFVTKTLSAFGVINSGPYVHQEYDGEDAEFDDEMIEYHIFQDGDVSQIFPYVFQAVTAAGILYNCYHLLNGL